MFSIRPIIPFLLTLFAASPAHAATEAVSLGQAFDAALKKSETVQISQEQLTQAEERYSQTRGALFPTLSFFASYTRQGTPTGGLGQSVSPSEQPLAKFSASQPLFRGLREFAALRQAKALTQSQEQLRQQAELQLFSDVASNYYTIAVLERDLQNLKTETQLLEERIQELQQRVRIGRSRPTEVLSVQASRASSVANQELLSSQIAVAREAFEFLTGLSSSTPLRDDSRSNQAAPASLETYLGRIEERPDVQALKFQASAANEARDVAWGAHLPSADLGANYYLKRSGVSDNVKWDVTASVSFPIFAGGVISSQVRLASSQEQQALLALSATRRSAEQQIRSAYDALKSDLAQIAALQTAAELSEKSYQRERQDYRLGLVPNIEVTTALESAQASRRALDHALVSSRLDRVRLEVASAQTARLKD